MKTPKWFGFVLAVMLATQVWAQVNVTGASWPAPGTAATAGNAGIQTLTGSGTLTYVAAPASDLWPGAAATSLIRAAVNTRVTILVESQVFGGVVSAGAQGTQSIWVRARVTDPSLITDGQFSGLANNTTLNGKAAYTIMQPKKDLNQPGLSGGLFAYTYNGTDSTGTGMTEGGYCVRGDGVVTGANGSKPTMPFNKWVEVTMYRKAGGAATGYAGLAINGQLTSATNTYDTGTTAAQQNAFTLILEDFTGVEWEVGAMKTTLTTGGTIPALFTDTYRAPANHTRSRRWPVTYSALTTPVEAYNWTITRASASDLYAIRPYSLAKLGGPQRERIAAKVRLATAANVHTCTSTRDLGTPDYNAEGWAWFVWDDVMVQSGDYYFEINNAANAAVALGMFIDRNGLVYQTNSATGTPIAALPTGPIVVCVCMAVNSDGRRYFAILDKTTNHAGSTTSMKKIIHHGPLDEWTPAALGKVIFRSGYSTNGYIEFAGFTEHRYLAIAACDSFSENRFPAINWGYWTYTAVGSGVAPTVGQVISGQITVQAIDTTNRVILGTIADDWSSTTGTYTGGTITGVSATLNPIWMGTGTITGTPTVGQTFTETTSGATARLLITTALDTSLIVPTGMAAFQPLAGNLTGGQTMTGTGGGAPTFTGDIPVIGCQRSNLLNGTSATVYGVGQDAYAPAFLCPYDNGTAWVPDFVAAAGRGGRTAAEGHQGASVQGIPAVFLWYFGGIANSLTGATPADADALADGYTRAIVAECVSVAENDGYAVWESPTFGVTGVWAQTYARRTFDRAVPAITTAMANANTRRRIFIVPNLGFPGSDDGTHYNVAGASLQAARAATYRANPTSGGGDRSGR